MRRTLLLVTVLITLVLAGCSSSPPPPPHQPTQSGACPAVESLFVPGTFETNAAASTATPVGLLAQVSAAMTEKTQVYFVAYPASFYTPFYFVSELAGTNAALAEMTATQTRCPLTRFELTGFSQGADVAGDLGSLIGRGQTVIPASKLIAVAMVSDPKRDAGRDKTLGPQVVGNGVEGPRLTDFGAVSGRTLTFCAPGDIVCSYIPKPNENAVSLLQEYAQFSVSRVHEDYGSYIVEPGRTATEYLSSWLSGRIMYTR